MEQPSVLNRFTKSLPGSFGSKWLSFAVTPMGASNGGATGESKKGRDGVEGSDRKSQKPLISQRSGIPGEAEMKKVFDKFDENNDGVIGVDELGRFMDKFGMSKSRKDLENIIKTVDGNKDGTIDFSEFYSLYTSLTGCDSKSKSSKTPEVEEEEDDEALRQAFRVFDKDGSGSISAAELQSVLKIMGITEGSSLKKCQQMIKSVDSNGDGVVQFDEFKKMMNSDIFKS